MEFRKINPQEYGELLFRMDVQAFCRSFDYPSRSVEMTLDYLKDCEVFLAYKNGTPIGLFAYKKDAGAVEVKQIIVLPEYQGKGFGKVLVAKLLETVKDDKVWLVTHPKNSRAIVLYLKSGFTIKDWKNDYYGDGEPRIILQHMGD